MITRTVHPLRHALVCAALAAGVSVYASYAQADGTATRVVKYREADLATDAGAQKLYRQLKAASRAVCATWRQAELMTDYQACYTKALADAVADVNQQTLTRLHDRLDAKSARVHRARAGKTST